MANSAIENCRYCLMCRHVAPVGHVMRDETHTPHGIALVAASQARGLLDWNDSTLRVLYAEPDTGHCRAHCVTDQRLPAAIAALRAEIAASELAPKGVYEVHERLKSTGSAFGERVFSAGAGETAFFVGDEAHNLWADCFTSARHLLRTAGVDTYPIGMGANTGYLACSLGFPDTARQQAQTCIDEARAAGARRVVVLAPGDLWTFQRLYPERLDMAWPRDIELIDLATLLAELLETGALSLRAGEGDAAFVDATHAVRLPERATPLRTLCSAALGKPPRELWWRRERAHPVGSTAVQFTRPDIAEQLTRARLEDAAATGAAELLSEDPGTLHHLERYAPDYDLRVSGLFETLASLA